MPFDTYTKGLFPQVIRAEAVHFQVGLKQIFTGPVCGHLPLLRRLGLHGSSTAEGRLLAKEVRHKLLGEVLRIGCSPGLVGVKDLLQERYER